MDSDATTPIFAALAGALQSGALLLGRDGRILGVNDAFAGLVGRPADELVGVGPPYPWLEDEAACDAVSEVLAGEREHRAVQCRISAPSGAHDVEVDVRAIADAPGAGGPSAVAVVRRMVGQRGLDLEFIARHVADVVSVHDPEGTTLFIGDACEGLFGVPADRITGRVPFGLFARPDRPRLRDAVARLRAGLSDDESITVRAVRPDRSEAVVDLNAHAVRDPSGALSSITCVARDATARLDSECAVARDAARRSQLRAAEQAALRRVALAAATENDPAAVFETVAREIAALLAADAVLVCRADGPGCSVVGLHGAVAGVRNGDYLDPAAVPALATAVGRDASATRSAPGEEQATPAVPAGLEGRAIVSAPVSTEGRLWGAVLAVALPGAAVTPRAERRLSRFCQVVGVAVGAADARRRLAAQAVTDPLTGLANHRAFQERLRGEVARAKRHGRTLSLAVLDLDHFKNLNDWYGHQEGDRALVEVAQRLRQAARSGDLVARVGGEEFAWILPETDGIQALEATSRAREMVAATPLEGGQEITLSAGVCDLAWAPTAEDLYRLADGALYWAKANGRNQVCLYSPEVVEPLSAEDRADWLARSHKVSGLRALVRAVDTRLPGAWPHAERVAALAADLALAMGWSIDAANGLREAGLLHDIGMIAVSDAAATTSGVLAFDTAAGDPHPVIGAEIARDALSAEQCGWIRHHHEHADGSGHPDGLTAERTPEGASILAVAEAWDALTGAGEGLPPEEALETLRADAGNRFAAEVIEALVRLQRGTMSAV